MTFGRANEREKSNWAGEHFSFVSPFLTVMGGGARLIVQKCFKSHLMSQRDREKPTAGDDPRYVTRSQIVVI